MIALIFALCALFLCACSEWYAWDGRRIESSPASVPDMRGAEAWAASLSDSLSDPDADLCHALCEAEISALDAMAAAMPLPVWEGTPTVRATPVAMRLGVTRTSLADSLVTVPEAKPKAARPKKPRKSRAKPKATV